MKNPGVSTSAKRTSHFSSMNPTGEPDSLKGHRNQPSKSASVVRSMCPDKRKERTWSSEKALSRWRARLHRWTPTATRAICFTRSAIAKPRAPTGTRSHEACQVWLPASASGVNASTR
eukprot:scaffold222674_cov24-Tisochrysis_lutea.AAC.1